MLRIKNRKLCCIDRDYVVVKYSKLFVRNFDIYSKYPRLKLVYSRVEVAAKARQWPTKL